MVRRRTNEIDERKRRLPCKVRIRRNGGWGRDSAAFHAAGDRIAGRACDWVCYGGSFEDFGTTICHFATPEQAAAMARWAAENDMHRDPPTKEEQAQQEAARAVEAAAMAAVVERARLSGVLRPVVQAYRRALADGKNEPYAGHMAHVALREADPTGDNSREHAEAMVAWARREHGEWFDRCRPPYHPVLKRKAGE
jgi:hypothetical protein